MYMKVTSLFLGTLLLVAHNQMNRADDWPFASGRAFVMNDMPDVVKLDAARHRPWMLQYAALHMAIMSEEAPIEMLKYVVWTCGAYGSCSGWANRMLGMASSLLLAVLTDRAFLIEWTDTGAPLDSYVRSDYIDWRIPDAFARERTPYSHDSRLLTSSTIDFPNLPTGDGQDLRRFFRKVSPENLTDEVLWVQSSIGWFTDLMRNPHFRSRLCELGLDHPDAALAQLVHVLFRPHGAAAAAVRRLRHEAAGRPILGIQARSPPRSITPTPVIPKEREG
jgi:hypothetical protein